MQARQAVVYCRSVEAVEAVSYKLTSRGIDALALVSSEIFDIGITFMVAR